LAFFAPFALHPLGHPLQVLADRFVIRSLTHWRTSFDKSATFSKGINEAHFVSK
jgi:hypothetical protein